MRRKSPAARAKLFEVLAECFHPRFFQHIDGNGARSANDLKSA
jgi:hypothetical protein